MLIFPSAGCAEVVTGRNEEEQTLVWASKIITSVAGTKKSTYLREPVHGLHPSALEGSEFNPIYSIPYTKKYMSSRRLSILHQAMQKYTLDENQRSP